MAIYRFCWLTSTAIPMRVMQLEEIGKPLVLRHRTAQPLDPQQVRVSVCACAVCRTDLHVVEGDLPDIATPLVPGHEIVGRITAVGSAVHGLSVGQRVGIPWLGWACGDCFYCKRGEENLCPGARFTGYQIDGGFADETVADHRFVLAIPENYTDEEAAPLLCAGLIGWRTLAAAGDGKRIGIYGFGAAAHIIAQVANIQGREVFAFVRPGDLLAERFAASLGARWAGPSNSRPSELLDSALIFAPVGDLVPEALKSVRPGGIVVCGGIHMSDIPRFPYSILWGERTLKSVANLTRADAMDFLSFAGRNKLHVRTTRYGLAQVNGAISDLRAGRITGAAVITP